MIFYNQEVETPEVEPEMPVETPEEETEETEEV